MMLQQTQVSRVVPAFEKFLRQFPSFAALARAPQSDVLRLWKGLGYNRRARSLHQAAQLVITKHHGRLPADDAALRALPGVGAYTSQAIRAFVFDEPVIAVDTNANRILARVFLNRDTLTSAQIKKFAPQLAAAKMGGRSDAASLMDFGALVCTSRAPHCSECPLRDSCLSAPRFLRGEIAPLTRRTQSPFQQTDRFLRGRIIDVLRNGNVDSASLFKHVRKLRPDLQSKKFRKLLADLEAERLIQKNTKRGKSLYSLA